MKKSFLFLILLLGWILSACGPAIARANEPTRTPVPTDGITQPPLSTEVPTTTPEIFNPLPSEQRSFEAVRAYLATELKIDPLSIKLVEIQPVNWPDSCLGLAAPQEMCAMMITPGYLIKVEAGSTTYEFHTDQGGDNFRQAP